MKYRIQIQQVFGGNWANFEDACQKAEWLEKDNVKPRSKAAALEALETQVDLYKNGAPHRAVAYSADGTFEVLYTLSRGTPWFVSSETPKQERPALDAQVVGRVMHTYQLPAVAATKVEHDRGQSFLANSARQLGVNHFVGRDAEMTVKLDQVPPGTYKGFLDSVEEVNGRIESKVTIIGMDHAAIIGGDLSVGFCTRMFKVKPVKRHRPKTYKPHALGIDTFKVIRIGGPFSIDAYRRALRQDTRVCAIEQELVQYAGKRCTPHRDRKVARLRKILRILKRGLYD